MGFDGEAFGQQMVEIVRGYLAAELEPIVAENKALAERVAELEAREIAVPERGEKGEDGPPGDQGPSGKDGEPGTPGKDGVDGKDGADGADGAPGKDGADGRNGHDVEDIEVTQDGAVVEFGFTVGDTRTIFEVELPQGPAGADGAQGERGEKGEKGDPGADGKLPEVKAWAAGVSYAGDVRSHAGGTYQATKDTASEPPHEDWTCLAAPGADGRDGQSLNPRRLWAEDAEYKRLDIVALNGGSFVALKDDPGPCPGDGWMLMTSPGKRGERGEKGERGERGPAAPVVAAMNINDEGVLTLTNADGSQVQCDFYPILAKISR